MRRRFFFSPETSTFLENHENTCLPRRKDEKNYCLVFTLDPEGRGDMNLRLTSAIRIKQTPGRRITLVILSYLTGVFTLFQLPQPTHPLLLSLSLPLSWAERRPQNMSLFPLWR